MAVHPNCEASNCLGALVSTRSMGLFHSVTVVTDNDTDPVWEKLGQTLGIKQIAYDRSNVKETQVCLDYANQCWIRRASQSDDWVKILTEDDVRTQLTSQGYPTNNQYGQPCPITISCIKYLPNGNCYVMFGVFDEGTDIKLPFSTGQYFMTSYDYGGTWNIKEPLNFNWRAHGSAAFGIQHGHNAIYGTDQIFYAAVHSAAGDRAGFVYSMDRGETWGPRDEGDNLSPYFYPYATSFQEPIPSWTYIDSFYNTYPVGLGNYYIHRLNNFCRGVPTNRSNGEVTEPSFYVDARCFYHPSHSRMYIGMNDVIKYTWTLEAGIPPQWGSYTAPGGPDVNAMTDYAQDMLYGFCNRYPEGHCIWGTSNDFLNVYKKSGKNPGDEIWDQIYDSDSIPSNCGGVTRNGIAMYDAHDDQPDPSEPPTNSGWPIWLTAGCRELRNDPSWDRLYVVAQTDWPTGSGLWQQPLLFQFILSGFQAYRYYENQGFLAFMPTVNASSSNIYSGSMDYNGVLEMHTESPLSHEVVVVGKFDEDKQVFYHDDITSQSFSYLSGWPISGWRLTGKFGGLRATSTDFDFKLLDDLDITHNQVTVVSGVAAVPWTWDERVAVPFPVNTSLREGNNMFVGVEGTGVSEPIRLITIIASGQYTTWQDRGGSLPSVQINRIKRSDA